MRRAAYFLLGFLAALWALTFFGSSSFLALSIVYAIGLYALFFARKTDSTWSFYLGAVVGAELLGGQRFGLHALYAYATNLLVIVFRDQLRFTSLGGRFAMALALSLIAYGLIFSGGLLPFIQWASLAGIFLVLATFALLRPALSIETSYESL